MYNYADQKPKLLTDSGQVLFIRFRDEALAMMQNSGAATTVKLLKCVSGADDSWHALAFIDRLEEIGDIRLVHEGSVTQHNVYVPSRQ